MRIILGLLKVAAALVILVAALIVGVLAALQTSAGRSVVANVIETLASSSEMQLEIKEPYVSWGLDVSVARLTLTDSSGAWFDTQEFDFRWRPSSLFAGRVAVDEISAKTVNLARLPASSATEAPTQEDQSSASSNFNLIPVSIDKIAVTEFDLGAAVADVPLKLSIEGSAYAATSPSSLSANLNVDRIDETAGRFTLAAVYKPTDEKLSFELELAEPRGGLAAHLLDIPDTPALDIQIKGDGPLTDWGANLAIALDGRQTVTGAARLTRRDGQNRLTAKLDGALSPLMPSIADAFFLGNTALVVDAHFNEDFTQATAQTSLTTATLALKTSAKLQNKNVTARSDLTVGAGGGAVIALQMSDRQVSFDEINMTATLDGALESADWEVELGGADIKTTEASLGDFALKVSGKKTNLSEGAPTSNFNLALALRQLDPKIEGLSRLAGDVSVKSQGVFDANAQTADLNFLTLAHPALTLALQKTHLAMNDVVTEGQITLPDLHVFSELAQMPLKGAANLQFTAKADPSAPTASAQLTLNGDKIKTGVAQADAILAKSSQLNANATYQADGAINLEQFSFTATETDIAGSASLDGETIRASLSATMSKLALLEPRAAGAMHLTAEVSGPLSAPKVKAALSSKQLKLMDKAVNGLKLDADLIASPTAPTGVITLAGTIEGKEIDGAIDIASPNGGVVIDKFLLNVGENHVNGHITFPDLQDLPKQASGQITIDATDLSEISPLVLTELAGWFKGEVILTHANASDAVKIDASGGDLVVPGASIGAVTIAATIKDPFDALKAQGRVTATNIDAGGSPIHHAQVEATSDGTNTNFSVDARLNSGPNADGVAATGFIQPSDNAMLIGLNSLDGRYQGVNTALAEPARILIGNETQIKSFALKLGSGSLRASGGVGETLDISATANRIPLSLANAFAPELALGGSLSATANVTGPTNAPQARWSATINEISAAPLRENGLPSLNVRSDGTFANNAITQTTVVSGPPELRLTASGSVNLSTQPILDIRLNGGVPLSLARQKLILSGFSGAGALIVNAHISGPASAPRYSGTVTPQGMKITELSSALTLNNFTGVVELSNEAVVLNGLSAKIAAGGVLQIGGKIGLESEMPADISVILKKGRYIDGSVVTADVDANLAFKGPLAGVVAPRLSGEVTILRADIAIPSTLPSGVDPVSINHRNAPQAVERQVAALRQDEGGASSSGPGVALDVKVSAPGRIFVRGRGLDAELGGALNVTGNTSNLIAIGQFSMRKGLFDILGKRLTFSKGVISFSGSMMPRLDFAATTSTSAGTITISVTGPAEDPEIKLSSSPELPQDEILAQLLFNNSMANLSPTQIAQLATAVATLTGGDDNGPLSQLRRSLGLDSIDIVNDGDSGPSLSAGKYINDNIYLGVQQGASGNSSRVTVDIDVTKNLKLRGEVGADGESKAGVFFEREY